MKERSESTPTWYVYLLRTRDGTIYTGVATDVLRRLAEHQAGGSRGARSLRGRGPLTLVYSARLADRGEAQRAEARIKRMTKTGKETIVSAAPGPRRLRKLLAL